MGKIEIFQVEFANGDNYTPVNIRRIMDVSELNTYRKRLEKVMSKRRKSKLKVSICYSSYPVSAEIIKYYHERKVSISNKKPNLPVDTLFKPVQTLLH